MHLGCAPEEPPLRITSRLCVYSRTDGEREWRLPADRPLYKHMYQLAMESIRSELAAAEGAPAVGHVRTPWAAQLRLERRRGRARAGGLPSDMGRALSARSCCIGARDECAASVCGLCAAPHADLLHKVSGECTEVPQETREQAKKEAGEALSRLEALIPKTAVEAPRDVDEPPPRWLPQELAAAPVQAVDAQGEQLFAFRRAHAGQCVAGERMMVAPGSIEDRALTPWLAWAIARAGSEAAAAGRSLGPSLQRACEAVQARAPSAQGAPRHEAGITAVHVLLDQLRPLVDETGGRVRTPPEAWADAAVAAARARGEHGFVQTARRSLRAGEGASNRRRYEAYASAPDGAVHWVMPRAAWSGAVRYLVVVDVGDDAYVLLHIRQAAHRPSSSATRSGGGERAARKMVTRVEAIACYPSLESTCVLSTGLPRVMPALVKQVEQPHRMATTHVMRTKDMTGEAAFVEALHLEDCERYAGGARVDVGRRTLFETHRWPAGPPLDEPVHRQIAAARRAIEGEHAHLSAASRAELALAVSTLMGNLLETPSAAAKRTAKQAEQAEAPAATAGVEQVLRVAVAGSQRDEEEDPGPGPGVHGVPIERGVGGALCNPFPMGEGGQDEGRRTYVCALHLRWLLAGTTRAADMLTVDLTPLPVDVRPSSGDADLTGEMAMTQLRAALARARSLGAEAIRLECGPRCRAGRTCHGDGLAAQLRWLRAQPSGGGAEPSAAAASNDASRAQRAEAQAEQDARREAEPAPIGLAQRVHVELRAFAASVWHLVDVRQRLRQRTREQEAAALGMTWQELRAQRHRVRKAELAEERNKAQEEQLGVERAKGKRPRGAPRAPAPPSVTAAQAVDMAAAGRPETLLDGWVVEVPLAFWGGAWHKRSDRIAAHLTEATEQGVRVQPCGSVLTKARWDEVANRRVRTRWHPTEVQLLWEDLRGTQRHGSKNVTCELLPAVELADGGEAEDDDERALVRREAALAARNAGEERASDRRRAKRRRQHVVMVQAEEEEEEAEAEGGEEEEEAAGDEAAAGDGEAEAAGEAAAGGAEEADDERASSGAEEAADGDVQRAAAAPIASKPAKRRRPTIQQTDETHLGELSRLRLLRAAAGAPPLPPPLPCGRDALPRLQLATTGWPINIFLRGGRFSSCDFTDTSFAEEFPIPDEDSSGGAKRGHPGETNATAKRHQKRAKAAALKAAASAHGEQHSNGDSDAEAPDYDSMREHEQPVPAPAAAVESNGSEDNVDAPHDQLRYILDGLIDADDFSCFNESFGDSAVASSVASGGMLANSNTHDVARTNAVVASGGGSEL